MGMPWEVKVWCVKDGAEGSGTEKWGYETVYHGKSLRQAIKVARRAKKEMNTTVKVIWR
jgi:hypothetical protein